MKNYYEKYKNFYFATQKRGIVSFVAIASIAIASIVAISREIEYSNDYKTCRNRMNNETIQTMIPPATNASDSCFGDTCYKECIAKENATGYCMMQGFYVSLIILVPCVYWAVSKATETIKSIPMQTFDQREINENLISTSEGGKVKHFGTFTTNPMTPP